MQTTCSVSAANCGGALPFSARHCWMAPAFSCANTAMSTGAMTSGLAPKVLPVLIQTWHCGRTCLPCSVLLGTPGLQGPWQALAAAAAISITAANCCYRSVLSVFSSVPGGGNAAGHVCLVMFSRPQFQWLLGMPGLQGPWQALAAAAVKGVSRWRPIYFWAYMFLIFWNLFVYLKANIFIFVFFRQARIHMHMICICIDLCMQTFVPSIYR